MLGIGSVPASTVASNLSDLVLAVDIGGTKMAVGLVGVDGSLVARSTTPTRHPPEAVADPTETLWADLSALVGAVVDARPADGRLVACGVGCGGPMTPGGEEVSPLNIPAWRDFPLRGRLAA